MKLKGKTHQSLASFIKADPDFIFIRIPKTASTTTCKLLEQKYNGRISHWSIKTVVDYSSESFLDNKFKFCFVRSPFSRLVSMYAFSQKRAKGLESIWNLSFKEWADINFQVSSWSNTDILSQSAWITLDGKVNMDFIGRLETFDKDCKMVCKRLNISYKSFSLNRSNHKNYKDYYTDSIKKKVYTLFEEDLERFKYKF